MDDSTLERVVTALREGGAEVGAAHWLAPSRACDVPFAGMDGDAADATARRALADAPIDVAAIGTLGRRKRLLLADMESTMIENEMVDEMADITGVGARIAEVTAATMAGTLEFAASLQQRAASFAGASSDIVQQALARVRLSPGAAVLVATMRHHGTHTVLLSGGFSCFAAPVGRTLGFDDVVANTLEIDGSVLTGKVRAPILDRAGKAAVLQRFVKQLGVGARDVLAIGDGANDLDMMRAAGLGVAYRAKPIVAAAAGARIDHADLRAVLYLQGYAESEIVTPDVALPISPR